MPDPELPPLVVIAGPTGAGKSAIAMKLALKLGGTIVAADSRQVYRHFDIGTAKPPPADRSAVPHELISVVEPTDTYTVARYQADARKAIARAHSSDRLPLLVGGTGFYIRAVLGGTPVPAVPPDPERRARLGALPDLWERLRAVDPEAAARIHPHDRFRLARALEVFEATGRPLSTFKAEPAPYRTVYVVIAPPKPELQARIARRMDDMLARGWEDEVDQIVAAYGADLGLLSTLGYAELMALRAGSLTRAEARERIARNTWRYARRQLTWFRGEPAAIWIEPEGRDNVEIGKVERAIASLG